MAVTLQESTELIPFKSYSRTKLMFLKYFKCLLASRYKNEEKLLSVAEKRITRHLDVVNFIKRSILLDTIVKLKMSKTERYLANRMPKIHNLDQ